MSNIQNASSTARPLSPPATYACSYATSTLVCGITYSTSSPGPQANNFGSYAEQIANRVRAENRQSKIDALIHNKAFVEKKLEDDDEYRRLVGLDVPGSNNPTVRKVAPKRRPLDWVRGLVAGRALADLRKEWGDALASPPAYVLFLLALAAAALFLTLPAML